MLITLKQMAKIYSANCARDDLRESKDGQFWLIDYFTTVKYDAGEQFTMIFRKADDGCGHEVAYLIIEGEDFKYVKHIFVNSSVSDVKWKTLWHPNTASLEYDRERGWIDIVQHPHVHDYLECDEDVRETAEAKLALLVLRYA